MEQRIIRVLFSRSISSLASPRLTPFTPSKSGLRRPFPTETPNENPSFSREFRCNFTLGFVSASSLDEMEGLIDADDPHLKDNSKLDLISVDEFAFLRESLMESDTVDASKMPKSEVSRPSRVAKSIADAISCCDDAFGNETLKQLRQLREKMSEKLVIEVLHLVRGPHLAVKFFLWAGRQIGYTHTGPVYDALLDVIVRDDEEKVPDEIFLEIREEDREVVGKLLNIMIRKRCENGLWNAAIEELGRLKDFGYRPSRFTYTALIQVFLKADRLDTASLFHREMSLSGLKMDAFTLRCFVHSLCKVGNWREALTLIEKEEFVPDTVIYTKMISGLCEASLFEEAMDFLNRMRADSCIPNVVTYSTLLCGFLNKKQLGRCKRILNMMITEGCYPGHKIFNSLVHAYCRSRDYSYAYKLLKKMARCGHSPGYVVYNILIGGICGNEDVPGSDVLELAEKAYDEMLSAGVVLNKINICNFARCLCGAGKFEKAYNIIREMMGKGFIPDASTYSKVINYLCNASKVEHAFLLFEDMKRNSLVPDVYTYTILIDSFCKAGLIKQARNWFDEMMQVGCTPNVVTYTALIHAYLKARKIGNANELFELMLSQGCVPNIVTYTALIDGHCKAGQTDKACRIYERMLGTAEIQDVDMYFRQGDSECEKPNVFTYGALVDGLCKAHKVKEAHHLLDAMSVGGCEPNHIVYDALIDGLCKVGKLDEAQEVFVKMSEHGYSPNVYTYSSLIDRLFKDKRLDLALKVLSKMLENSCAPNVVIYTEMIDGLCKVGKTDEAYKLMQMMEEKGCFPNVVTYTAMIDGFGNLGEFEQCFDLLKRMTSKGVAPNFITYSVLINHCCATGRLDEARKLLDEMKQTYWPVHVGGYSKVIEGFSKEFIASLGLLDETTASSSAPVIATYKILINSFIKSRKLEVALELHEEVASLCPPLAVYGSTYDSLIQSLSLANKVDKAFELFAEFTNKGGIPNLQTLFSLVKGLIHMNKWNEALVFLDSVCRTEIGWVQKDNK